MKTAFYAAVLLLLAIPLSAEDTPFKPSLVPLKATPAAVSEIHLTLPTAPVVVGDMVQIPISGIPSAALPKAKVWVAPAADATIIVGQGLKPGDPVFIVFRTLKPGLYTFIVAAPDGTGDMITTEQTLTVTGTAPTPPGPTPPGPTPPGPTPPGPTPDPTIKPRVLVMYDSNAIGKMPEPQRQMLFSTGKGSFREYLDANVAEDTVSDASGGKEQIPARRFWYVGVDASKASPLWVPLVKEAGDTPCIVVQRGTDIKKYPLPATSADAIKLISGGQ